MFKRIEQLNHLKLKIMKTIKISVLALTLGLMSFSIVPNPIEKVSKNVLATAITWKSETVEVGEIPQGTPKKIEFEFKNNSKQAVLISTVAGSCGCTATDYTKTPIGAGQVGKITATYNAASIGQFSKTVSVTTTAETSPKILTLKGTVVLAKVEIQKS